LGYQTQQSAPNRLDLIPYWFVETTPPDVAFQWWLSDAEDNIISRQTSFPYFNTWRTSSWSAGMLVDDAYQLSLPPNLSGGSYGLWLQIIPQDGQDLPLQPQQIGTVELADNRETSPVPNNGLDIRFSDDIILDGYDLNVNGHPMSTQESGPIIVKPDDFVEYTLYWRATESQFENYHGFIHWLDGKQEAILKQDQLPGPYLSPPVLWNPFYAQPDIYRFTVPDQIKSGLYTPRLGLYNYATGDHLSLYDQNDTLLGDAYNLPALKIFNPVSTSPEHIVDAKFDQFAKFLGYDLESIQANETLTVTLYYEGLQPTAIDYTQFVHLYHPELGMAAQVDSKPQQGQNPTNVWVVGEILTDTIVLNPSDEAPSGAYRLQIGLYHPQTGERVPTYGSDGAPLADRQIILTNVIIP